MPLAHRWAPQDWTSQMKLGTKNMKGLPPTKSQVITECSGLDVGVSRLCLSMHESTCFFIRSARNSEEQAMKVESLKDFEGPSRPRICTLFLRSEIFGRPLSSIPS